MNMKKLIAVLLILSASLTVFSCKSKDKLPNFDESAPSYDKSPYGKDADNDGPYITDVNTRFSIYNDRIYFITSYCSIVYRELGMPRTDLRTLRSLNELNDKIEEYRLCPDPTCYHDFNLECPSYLHDPDARFIIDAKESAGELPIIYFFRCTAGDIQFNDAWESGQGYEIIRYDTGANIQTQIALVQNPIRQIMVYEDKVYFLTQNSKDRYDINTVSKDGGAVTTHAPGESSLYIVGANSDGIYVNDDKGNVYSLDLNGNNPKKIFTAEEYYVFVPSSIYQARLNFMVYEEYLYYFDNFQSVSVPGNRELIKHDVMRVPLSNTSAEGELVIRDNVEDLVYGIYDGYIYYAPFDASFDIDLGGIGYTYSNGVISAVSLDTLEKHAVIKSGLNYGRARVYVTDRCIIATPLPFTDEYGFTFNEAGGITTILDFETGALYVLCENVG